jgi:hypothetical protein
MKVQQEEQVFRRSVTPGFSSGNLSILPISLPPADPWLLEPRPLRQSAQGYGIET